MQCGLDTQHSHQRHSHQQCVFNHCNSSFSPFEIAKTTHILPLSLSPIVDSTSTNKAATTLEAITALLWNCITSNPQVRETPALAIAVSQTAA
jgi:hypothetical protein